MVKVSKLLVILILCLMIVSLSACSNGNNVSSEEIDKTLYPINLATGPESGLYYPLGQSLALVLQNELGYETFMVPTSGSVENIQFLMNDEANMIFAMSDAVLAADYSDLYGMMSLYPNYIQVITTDEAEIGSISDLSGKKVAVGAESSGVEQNARLILSAYNLDYNTINPQYLDYAQAVAALQNGTIDAAFLTSGVPCPVLEDVPGVVVLPIEGVYSEKLIEQNTAFSTGIIPIDTYGNDKEIPTIVVMNVLLVDKEMPDEIVFDLLTGIYNNIDTIKGNNKAFSAICLENGVVEMPVTWHPGAEKFFKEKGVL